MKNQKSWETELQKEIALNRQSMDKSYQETKERMVKYLDSNPGTTVDDIFQFSELGELEFHYLVARLLEDKYIEADDGKYYVYGSMAEDRDNE